MNIAKAFEEIAVAASAQQCRAELERAVASHYVRVCTIRMLAARALMVPR